MQRNRPVVVKLAISMIIPKGFNAGTFRAFPAKMNKTDAIPPAVTVTERKVTSD